MNLRELANNLAALRKELEAEAAKILYAEANSTVAELINRSIDDGVFKDGLENNVVGYSVNPVRTSGFKKEARNQAGRDYVKANPFGTWGAFRKAQGLESKTVNLSYNNQMWRAVEATFRQEDVVKQGYVFSIGISSLKADKEVAKKLANNLERYGDFLTPSKSEISRYEDRFQKSLETFMKQYL